jgi:hypothetical protein
VDRKTLAIMMTLVVAGRGSAWAQDTAAIKKALNRVPPGATISILDSSGRTETGRLSDATDTLVTLDGSRTVAANRIKRITVKDSTKDGATIGAAIGGGAGVLGALAFGALCANEGGNCAGAGLLLIGLGVGAGAGIGWLGDSLTQHDIYRAGDAPRKFSPEARVRVAGLNRSGALPSYGLSWSLTTDSGFGVEVNADKNRGHADGEGRGFSFDGRALYAFGHGRVQPFVSGGVAFAQHDHKVTQEVPPSAFLPNGATFTGNQDVEGVAPVFGGGIRLQPARHLVIRPEVSWFIETAPNSANRTAVPRVGVSIGAAW